MSLSSEVKSGFNRIKERLPRKGKGASSLLEQLNDVLAQPENKWVQKIVVEASKPYLYLEKMVPKEMGIESIELTLDQAVRHKPMMEMAEEKIDNPRLFIQTMFEEINRQGYEVSHVLVGEDSALFPWIDIPRKIKRLYGVPITKSAEIPNDVLVICGAIDRDSGPEDVEYSVKGTIL